ncbi:hypothetical protein HMPREF0401_01588 [Fusobacterium animalis 11_3_2]|uniref:Uncharacterized protein n=2 Tax=Fusobacterium animalis TaxID=76859 RepID=F7L167_9FUSO|nr:hypothetical protein HMPREF0401_01588 [Fusobacterium animalis 11_3_2]
MTNTQKYCIMNYTEYKGVLNILLYIVNFIVLFMQKYHFSTIMIGKIGNSENSYLKKHKEQVIIMMETIFYMYITIPIVQELSTNILQGTDSTFLYVQYNNRL